MPDLSVSLRNLSLKWPTLTCSGTSGYGPEYVNLLDFSQLGAFVTKSITLHERLGNAPSRIVETRGGMLNAIGLANVGLDRFKTEKLAALAALSCPIIVNVAGHSVDDYVQTCAAVHELPGVAAVELNVSCPNVKDGLTFGTDPRRLRELCRAAKSVLPSKPLIVKLSPNVEDITQTAKAAIDGGASILSLVNTFTAMSIDVWKRRPRLANGTGGLSGPAIKPIALHLVNRVHRSVAKDAGVPLIGMGGVQNWQDAVEFILAGASAVAIGTALFVDPATPNKVNVGITAYLEKIGVERLSDLVGTLEMNAC